MENILVVGSSLSGYSVIKKLLGFKKIKITLIDNSNLDLIKEYKNYSFQNDILKVKGLNKKAKINQNFLNKLEIQNSEIFTTNIFGGLSNIWSGASLPFDKNFFDDQKINEELMIYYREIYDTFNFSERYKGFLHRKIENLKKKSIIKDNILNIFLKNFNSNQNYEIGKSILFLKSNLKKNNNFYKEDIFNARFELLKLIKNNTISYLENHKLEKFEEKNNKVLSYLIDKNIKKTMKFDRIFLASGVINTTQLVANSLNLKLHSKILETRSFKLPLFYYGLKFNSKLKISNLPQLFIVDKKNKSKIFFQLSYDPDLLRNYLSNKFFLIKLIPSFLLNLISKRVLIIWGFLDTKNTNSFLKYNPNKKNFFVEKINANIEKKLIRQFIKNFSNHNFFSSILFLNLSQLGESNHFGSSFPMGRKNLLHSDTLGRVKNMKKVHIVDSSILPDIQPGPISFVVMANAMRIVDKIFKNN